MPSPPALASSLLDAAASEYCYGGDAPSEPCHCYLWRGTHAYSQTDRQTWVGAHVLTYTHTIINHTLWGFSAVQSLIPLKMSKWPHLSKKASVTTTIHYMQLVLEFCVLKGPGMSTPKHPCDGARRYELLVRGVNWWQLPSLTSDSGRVWVCCSADGPVIRRRDRRAHSFSSLAAPLWDC